MDAEDPDRNEDVAHALLSRLDDSKSPDDLSEDHKTFLQYSSIIHNIPNNVVDDSSAHESLELPPNIEKKPALWQEVV